MLQSTADVHPLLGDCWSTVADGGPTITRQWVNISCLPRSQLKHIALEDATEDRQRMDQPTTVILSTYK